MRWGPTPQAAANRLRTAATWASTKGHTAEVNGPNAWIVRQLAMIASREGSGRGPWPP